MKQIKNILLIDDNASTNFYNNYILKDVESIENIVSADSVESALEILQNLNSVNDEINPSLVFLDVNLPKYTGFELLGRCPNLVSNLVKKGVRIFMLSSSQNPSDLKLVASNPLIEGFYEKPLTVDIIDEIALSL